MEADQKAASAISRAAGVITRQLVPTVHCMGIWVRAELSVISLSISLLEPSQPGNFNAEREAIAVTSVLGSPIYP